VVGQPPVKKEEEEPEKRKEKKYTRKNEENVLNNRKVRPFFKTNTTALGPYLKQDSL